MYAIYALMQCKYRMTVNVEGNERRNAASKMADLGAVLFTVRCKSSHYRTAHKSLK